MEFSPLDAVRIEGEGLALNKGIHLGKERGSLGKEPGGGWRVGSAHPDSQDLAPLPRGDEGDGPLKAQRALGQRGREAPTGPEEPGSRRPWGFWGTLSFLGCKAV